MSCNCQAAASITMDPEQRRLFESIGMVDFVVVEMTLYLDTHPFDRDALNYFNYYNRMNNKLHMEYASKYTPLNLATADTMNKEWKWGLAPLPWEVGC